jgi:hypothetical protein
MRYLLLIYQNEADYAKLSPQEQEADFAAYATFAEEGQKRGALSDEGIALNPTDTATTIRVRDGKTVPTDGPFAETKEQLGGTYLINAKNLDEAIELAALIPAAKTGSVEIRPVMEFA